MAGYWMKPQYVNAADGGNLIVGPLQVNWYNGLRVHLTWPVSKTITLRRTKANRDG